MSDNHLKLRIQEDMKIAMRARDRARLLVIRMLLAAIKQREIDERIVLDETDILSVIEKMIKQRNDSVEQFTRGDRKELAAKELAEIEVLRGYLPKQLTKTEIQSIIKDAITTTDAKNMKDMGKVMTIIKPKVQSRADIGQISATIKSILTNS